MIVNSNGKLIVSSGGKIKVTDPVNYFDGTVNALWNNPSNWSLGIIPNANQTAIIRANCQVNINNAICKTLQIESNVVFDFNSNTRLRFTTLYNNGIINCNNDFSHLTPQANPIDNIWGVIDFGVNGIIDFEGSTYALPDLDYYNVRISQGLKFLTKTTTFRGYYITGGTNNGLSCGVHSLYINGPFQPTTSNNTALTKNSSVGEIVFRGTCSTPNLVFNFTAPFRLEFQNGITYGNGAAGVSTGSALVYFTTRNQNINPNNNVITLGNVTIDSGLTINNTGSGTLQINGNINGNSSSSTFNSYVGLSMIGANIMSTGVFNHYSGNVNYSGGNQNVRVPDNGGTYNGSFSFQGTGVKTLTGDIIITGNLGSNSTGPILDVLSYNLTVNGTTTIQGSGSIRKNSNIGVMLFKGLLLPTTGNLTLSNQAQVECQGGFQSNNSAKFFNDSIFKFTTNNQSILINQTNSVTFGKIIIDNDIILTLSGGSLGSLIFNEITGLNSNSEFINNYIAIYTGDLLSKLMPIGKFTHGTNTTFYYSGGNQEVKQLQNNYFTLRISGTGIKTLTQDINTGTLVYDTSATIDYNGFSINGVVNYYDLSDANRVQPSGTYNIYQITGSGSTTSTKTLSGDVNATTLIRNSRAALNLNGFNMTKTNFDITFAIGTENIPADTYRNIFLASANGTRTLLGNVTVTGYINNFLSNSTISLSGHTLICDNFYFSANSSPGNIQVPITTLNVYLRTAGTNALISNITCSNLIIDGTGGGTSGTINFNSFVINCDNWSYMQLSNQPVYSRTYNDLNLGGSGIKTLQGNVIVTGAYSRTGTATVDLNGFTLKDGLGNNITP